MEFMWSLFSDDDVDDDHDHNDFFLFPLFCHHRSGNSENIVVLYSYVHFLFCIVLFFDAL